MPQTVEAPSPFQAIVSPTKAYRDLFELSPDAIVAWDGNGVIQIANQAAATLFGYDKAEDIVGKHWLDFVPPEDRSARVETIRTFEKSGGITENEFRMQRKDGRRFFIHSRRRTALDSAGNPIQTISIARDITERRQAEAALYLSEARFRSAFEAAGHGMALVDLDGRFLKVNAAFCQITGYSEDEMLARSFADFTVREDLAVSAEAALRMRNGEIPSFEIEKRYVRKDGGIVWVQLNVSMVHDAAGAPVYQVAQAQDITDRKAMEAGLLKRALRDSLTGLPNRPAFVERLQEAFASSKRGGRAFAVLYLDLDRFKEVNDTLGHAAGDRLLQEVAARLKGAVRDSDFIARFGGDEFAILQTYLNDPSDTGVLAVKLTKLMAAAYQIDGNDVLVSASTGISVYGTGIADPEAMLTQADLALYRAKAAGRDQYCFHSAELDREVHERVELNGELRAALENLELEIYYQPQVELVSGRIVGLEALVRWNHPVRGLVMPMVFIPIAETTGSIPALGRWELNQICRQIKAWRDQGIAPPPLAINVSAAELRGHSEFEQFLAECLQRWSIAPGDIELEFTETVLMETAQTHGDALARLKALGVNIAIDDFGTGWSSLAYLSAHPIDHLKIAQKVVLAIPENADDVAVTKLTLELARTLGARVIAEGVQTKSQLDFLLSAGCSVGQGFYFSKAVQAECATKLLRRGYIQPGANDGE
jgi:diguanylate cyclase (GGDEF)-like protein/PAS domain S-box-containing protein